MDMNRPKMFRYRITFRGARFMVSVLAFDKEGALKCLRYNFEGNIMPRLKDWEFYRDGETETKE